MGAATVYMWTASYAAAPPAPAHLPWWHRAPQPNARVEVDLGPDAKTSERLTFWFEDAKSGAGGPGGAPLTGGRFPRRASRGSFLSKGGQ